MTDINVLMCMCLVTFFSLGLVFLSLMDTRSELKALTEMVNTLTSVMTTQRSRIDALSDIVYATPDTMENAEPKYVSEDESMSANLSIQERILMRESEFDRRINEMKNMYGVGVRVAYNPSAPAKTLHPNVHNIPHEAVDLRDAQLPDVEETD
jgi:hypothetical protein